MSSDKDFLPIFQKFVLHLQENLYTHSWKSAEGFVDGHCCKIRVIRKRFFFNQKYIICFRSAPFQVDDEGNTKDLTSNKVPTVERWMWEEYEEKHEHNAYLHRTSGGYMKAEDIIEHYKECGYNYDWITGFQNS